MAEEKGRTRRHAGRRRRDRNTLHAIRLGALLLLSVVLLPRLAESLSRAYPEDQQAVVLAVEGLH